MHRPRIGIIGATGYSGQELIKILMRHSGVRLALITSRAEKGQALKDYYPFAGGEAGNLLFSDVDLDEIKSRCDLVFFATPSGTAKDLAPKLLEKGVKVVDISGDFRLSSAEDYEKWYGYDHPALDWLSKAVYCLPEINREEARKADFISNPGCYPTSVLLPLIPVLKVLELQTPIIIDAKSGVSGAGKKASADYAYCELNENFSAYKAGRKHQHIPEIEKYLTRFSGKTGRVVFTPHLIPMDRGILSTLYLTGVSETGALLAQKTLKAFYEKEPFVKVFEKRLPKTRDVAHTNQCHIGSAYDAENQTLILVSVIDNLLKGAAGQGVQNMNLMLELKEDEGLC